MVISEQPDRIEKLAGLQGWYGRRETGTERRMALSPQDVVKLKHLRSQYEAAALRASEAVTNFGPASSQFKAAMKEAGAIRTRIRELEALAD